MCRWTGRSWLERGSGPSPAVYGVSVDIEGSCLPSQIRSAILRKGGAVTRIPRQLLGSLCEAAALPPTGYARGFGFGAELFPQN